MLINDKRHNLRLIYIVSKISFLDSKQKTSFSYKNSHSPTSFIIFQNKNIFVPFSKREELKNTFLLFFFLIVNSAHTFIKVYRMRIEYDDRGREEKYVHVLLHSRKKYIIFFNVFMCWLCAVAVSTRISDSKIFCVPSFTLALCPSLPPLYPSRFFGFLFSLLLNFHFSIQKFTCIM
jgi:hypothetical protein